MATVAASTFASPDLIFHTAQWKCCPYFCLSNLCYPVRYSDNSMVISRAKNRNSPFVPVVRGNSIRNGSDFGNSVDDIDDDFFEEDLEEEESELYIGDGSGGGGIMLAGTWWDKEALALAERVSISFDKDLSIYAFRTFSNSTIRVRIEKLSSKYGSLSMTDIEDFSSAYRALLDEAEQLGTMPENISLEVSSPGIERIVQIPGDLERFKDLPMYVRYNTGEVETGSSQESDGILNLISFDLDARFCTWCLADVRANREKAGKGKPLSKKQREWRLQTPFESLRLVRRYSEC
ncbi:hypothetical protein H6P81_001745 [Aristolochia fimbriata]|uniref:Ribosome maturation factor RimP N-terminal domain-containing protein n=1 Tax=Aristolochia fimbriata TaxID=158543 RepID=A0AAV7F7U9_ARIFI|nr:hypothetical protein H6P81_001745 [Aristolochia fimbriata]